MRVGLISDTHIPLRWKTLPSVVHEIFADCSLILHAGDVGELWVLDELSQIAPIIAVHGNDETDEATAALPFLQTLVIEGHRVVLTHSHYPDFQIEMENRKNDSWYPKLDYRANFGKTHGANIVITGHTHIPMNVVHEGVLLVNPGAIASGSAWSAQAIQTVAILALVPDHTPEVTFYDLTSMNTYTPDIDWDAGYVAQLQQVTRSIVSDDLLMMRDWIMDILYPQYPMFVKDAILPLCHEVWSGNRDQITLDDAARAFLAKDPIPEGVFELLQHQAAFANYINT